MTILAHIEFGRLVISLYVHEIALHINHNIDEFKTPFSAKSLKSSNFAEDEALSTAYLSMIQTLIMAAQGLLDIFIGLSTSDSLALPPLIYASLVLYAVILLMKLHKALSGPVNKLGQVGSIDQLRLDTYVEQLFLISKHINVQDGGSSLSRAFLIVPQLEEWLRGHISKSTSRLNGNWVEKQTRTDNGAGLPVLGATNGVELPRSLPAAMNEHMQTRPGRSKLGSDLGSQVENPSGHD